MEKKKTSIVLMLVAIIALLTLIVGATYAYFKAIGNSGSETDVNVLTATSDLLTFKIDNDINISVGQSDFKKGAGNKSDSTKASAILTASNSKNIESTSDRYNIYFIIEANDFIYTTDNATAEILLNVTDPNGNEVENITGLVHTDKGFDITTRTGGFLLVPDYDISATRGNTTIQEWKVEVTLVNLDTDQTKNTGKTLSGKLFVTKEKMGSYELTKITNVETETTYNSIKTTLQVINGTSSIEKYYYGIDKNKIKTNMYETEITTNTYNIAKINSVTHTSTLNSITLNVYDQKGDTEIVKYFYSKDNGATYVESTSSTYTFNNLTDTTEYKIKVKVLDSYGRYSTEYAEAIATTTYILPSVTKVTPTTKYNQITVVTTGTKGTNEISKYYYSINNSSYVEGTSTYTFTNLNEQTTYNIKVKVADTNGRMSNEYSLSATTDAYKLPTITDVTTSSTTNSITININSQKGDGAITEYYYSKDDGSNYVKSTSSSYTFTNLTSSTSFYIKVYVKDSNERVSSKFQTSVWTKQLTIANFCSSGSALTTCVKNFGNQGSDISNIYIHNSSLTNGAGDNSYRYAGEIELPYTNMWIYTNNYVCFGSNASTCPTDNLYRIIGVIDGKVKLIKYDYANSNLLGTNGDYSGDVTPNEKYYQGSLTSISTYYWNYKNDTKINKGKGSNTWSTSSLNKINLNTNFINNIGTTWSSKIATTTWKVGGNTYENIIKVVPATAYQNEVANPTPGSTSITGETEYRAKIGLTYISDYGFATSSGTWKNPLSNFVSVIRTENWMHMGGYEEWTITRRSDYSYQVLQMNPSGSVGYDDANEPCGVRPAFFLNSSVKYVSGDGTYTNPIRIN